jgi:hypothetical protein
MRGFKKDANHQSVVDRIQSLGWSVLDLSKYGAPVDIAIGKLGRSGLAALGEIKDGSKPPSKRKLTKEGEDLFKRWEGPIFIFTSPDDAQSQLACFEEGKR